MPSLIVSGRLLRKFILSKIEGLAVTPLRKVS
jgi:hypothetical protein